MVSRTHSIGVGEDVIFTFTGMGIPGQGLSLTSTLTILGSDGSALPNTSYRTGVLGTHAVVGVAVGVTGVGLGVGVDVAVGVTGVLVAVETPPPPVGVAVGTDVGVKVPVLVAVGLLVDVEVAPDVVVALGALVGVDVAVIADPVWVVVAVCVAVG